MKCQTLLKVLGYRHGQEKKICALLERTCSQRKRGINYKTYSMLGGERGYGKINREGGRGEFYQTPGRSQPQGEEGLLAPAFLTLIFLSADTELGFA